MNVGDIVNIKASEKGTYWKGRIYKIVEGYNDEIKYTSPIAHIKGLNGVSGSVNHITDFIFKDNEYWEE